MVPLMGFLVFVPIPTAIIHPMLRFEIGYNSLFTIQKPIVLLIRLQIPKTAIITG